MAVTIGLSAYTLRLRKRNAHDPAWLTMSRKGEVDVWEMLHRHLLNRKNQVIDLRGFSQDGASTKFVSKAFQLIELHPHDESGTFAGRIETGDYGRASKIVDIKTKKLAHHKTVNQADMPPFYFRIHVPDGGTTAVMVLQRIGLQGLKGTIEMDLSRYFAQMGYTARIGTLTDRDLLNEYLTHGQLQEITVLTHTLPSDPRDAIKHTKINGQRPPAGTKMEISFSKKNGFGAALDTARDAFRSKKSARDLVEVYGLENPEEVTFSIDLDGVSKRFRVMHPDEIGVKYDVTDNVQFDNNHHPTFASIDQLAKQWCKTLMKQVNSSVNGN